MKEIVQQIAMRCGVYEGEGKDSAGDAITGRLELVSLLDGRGLWLTFTVTDLEGTTLHDERSIIGLNFGDVAAHWMMSGDLPWVAEHDLRRVESSVEHCLSIIFGLGDPTAQEILRQEIAIDLWGDGDVGYRFSRGMPDEPFTERWSVRMRPVVGARDLAVHPHNLN